MHKFSVSYPLFNGIPPLRISTLVRNYFRSSRLEFCTFYSEIVIPIHSRNFTTFSVVGLFVCVCVVQMKPNHHRTAQLYFRQNYFIKTINTHMNLFAPIKPKTIRCLKYTLKFICLCVRKPSRSNESTIAGILCVFSGTKTKVPLQGWHILSTG